MSQQVQLTITPRAAEKVKELARTQNLANPVLRVYITGGGCSGYRYGMALDENIYEDDLVLETDGVKVVVDAFSHSFMEGSEIDYAENVMGSGFIINNPNVVATCGCGHSFSVKQ